jgi:bifunctional ADP-heptose synthase (sugar kinase/adenylyltransferase)
MTEARIREILEAIGKVEIAVYGDFCLDAYWQLDPRGSEVSVETGLPARAVARQSYTPGGAANVVANLAALTPASIRAIGVIGDDLFGRELYRQLQGLGVDTQSLVVQHDEFDTVTFGKPHLGGDEQPRLDFGFFNRRSRQTDAALLRAIHRALETVDALVVNQQVPGSIPDEVFIEEANRLFDQFGKKVVLVDSRHYGLKFKHCYRKTNQVEAGLPDAADPLSGGGPARAVLVDAARRLYGQGGKPVFLTCASRGIIVVDAEGVHEVPAPRLPGPLHPVGAGDTVTSALALCLGGGVSPPEAAEFASLAAAVTVQKHFQTGTASGDEILSRWDGT